jgi:DNA polymerase III delta prime subunit
MKREKNPLWCEKWRPQKVADCILPKDIKDTFQRYVDDGMILNTLVSGGPGMGKTTVLKAVVEQLGADYIFVNGSLKGNIDTLRNEIQEFASTVSFSGGRKYVILDEADNLTLPTQLALRSFVESYSNTGFLLSCNHPHRIEEALISRMAHVEFRIPKGEKPRLAKEIYTRVCSMLDSEGVTYDKSVIIEVVKRYFPDFRKTIMELQRYSAQSNKTIDADILDRMNAGEISGLVKLMKEKNFTAVRKWIGEHGENESMIYRDFYDKASEMVTGESVPPMILILAEYEYRSAFVADKEINMAACLAQIMAGVTFK